MRSIFLVLKHEFLVNIRRRSFWVITLLFPILVVGLSIGSMALAENGFADPGGTLLEPTDFQRAGYVDQAGIIETLPAGTPPGLLRPYPSETEGRNALREDQVDRLYLIPRDYLESGAATIVVREYSPIRNFGSNRLIEFTISLNLIGDEQLARLSAEPISHMERHALEPVEVKPRAGLGQYIPYGVMFLVFMTFSTTGNMMLSSVAQEKEDRTVEILLVSLNPRQLMAGKLAGIGMLALLQMLVWLTAIAFAGRGGIELIDQVLASLGAATLFWGLVYLLLGYATFASALGAIGALSPSAREGAQFSILILAPMFIPLILNNLFLEQPHGTLATALSLIPFTSPLAMITRLVVGGVPLWQRAFGALLMLGAATIIVHLAGRFFRADTLLATSAINLRRIIVVIKGATEEA